MGQHGALFHEGYNRCKLALRSAPNFNQCVTSWTHEDENAFVTQTAWKMWSGRTILRYIGTVFNSAVC